MWYLCNTFVFTQTLKDEDTKKDYDYMLDHPGILSAIIRVHLNILQHF